MKKFLNKLEKRIARFFLKRHLRIYQSQVWASAIELEQGGIDIEFAYKRQLARSFADELLRSGAIEFSEIQDTTGIGTIFRARVDIFQP